MSRVWNYIYRNTNASYTNVASFLDGNNLPIYGEKPNDWKPSPKRIKRGLYRSGNNWLINADCKVAANIITKVSRKLRLNLSRLCRGTMKLSPENISLVS
ncbi:hypothetical protein [Okeania sp. SIO3B5]|uniref:hypothetical protein n=1 Tax=Okeania sp. SIO3B5 TaxID=2607811 RepID=UPI0025D60F4A|nr:hypothetical protein [Okeania sp. SIO3B5]